MAVKQALLPRLPGFMDLLQEPTHDTPTAHQVLISKDESVAGRVVEHVKGLEAEVNVLKHLDHPNIVRYLVRGLRGFCVKPWKCHTTPCAVEQGTDRDQQHLNIFLEFVPGGSIASLLAKFGARACHSFLVMISHSH